MDLLGGGSADAEASRALMPDADFSSDEEAPAEVDLGPAVVLDHTAKLTTTLSLFAWEPYEVALARLAGVEPECVFVTPEPGSGTIVAHATIIKKLVFMHRARSMLHSSAVHSSDPRTIQSLQRPVSIFHPKIQRRRALKPRPARMQHSFCIQSCDQCRAELWLEAPPRASAAAAAAVDHAEVGRG